MASAGEYVASFVVISDTHLSQDRPNNSDRFANALADIKTFDPAPNTLVLLGDITDNGNEDEYEIMRRISHEQGYNPNDFVLVMGNHDQYSDDFNADAVGSDDQYLRFMANAQAPRAYYDMEMQGQHFICLGPDCSDTGDWVRFGFSDEEIAWLTDLLDKDQREGRMSYVFCHEPLWNTVPNTGPGTWAQENSLEDNDELARVVAGRPNVVFFSGHIHLYPSFAQPDANGPLFVNDGAVGPCQITPDATMMVPESYIGSFGVLVTLYTDHLEVRARDFFEHAWIDGFACDYPLPTK